MVVPVAKRAGAGGVTCEYCEAARYAYDSACHGCRVRSLARTPRQMRQAIYRRVRETEGELSAQLLVQEVNAWYREHRRGEHGTK